MKVSFATKKYPELQLEFDIKPKLFGLNIQLKHANKNITSIEARKHRYRITSQESSYELQVSNTPYNTSLTINNDKFELVEKPNWYDFLIGGIPFILMVSGGALGGGFGFLGWYANMNFLRFDQGYTKYLKVLAMTLGVGVAFFLVAGLIQLAVM